LAATLRVQAFFGANRLANPSCQTHNEARPIGLRLVEVVDRTWLEDE
jgi:hypothetical protein